MVIVHYHTAGILSAWCKPTVSLFGLLNEMLFQTKCVKNYLFASERAQVNVGMM